ncbi:pro-melanin-concentrating hormone, like [Thalassophryne amazonica]|uniref:pro-melanin-concentrating hormone, like n=1 Tax=Thalassophryne amazonica TaxID=390379 RepID=UPI001471D628|nr:pro-melanin-concentrating hormone, like [Thalassophryne amazonica]
MWPNLYGIKTTPCNLRIITAKRRRKHQHHIFTMRQSLLSFVFAAVLLFERCTSSPVIPRGQNEDRLLEQDAFASILRNDMAEDSLGDADLAIVNKPRGAKLIIVADPSLWRDLRVLHGGLALYKRRSDDSTQILDVDLSVPILRKDTMRCMVGRVYRPCWEA